MSTKANRKIRKLNIIVSVVAALCLLTLAITAAVATWVTEQDRVTGATNSFTLNGGSYFSSAVTLGAGETTLSVTCSNENPGDTTAFDLIIMPDTAIDTTNITVSAGTRYLTGTFDTAGTAQLGYTAELTGAVVYTQIPCPSGSANIIAKIIVTNSSGSAINASVAVVRHTDYNSFVGSMHELKLAANEYLFNPGDENIAKDGAQTDAQTGIHTSELPIGSGYRNVYIVNSFTVDEDYIFNVPAFIDLLDNNVTISSGVTLMLKHGNHGIFSISSQGGKFKGAGKFIINTPYAYYITEGTQTGSNPPEFTNSYAVDTSGGLTFTKTSDMVDISKNADVLAAVKADAAAYIENYLKRSMYAGKTTYYKAGDIKLPTGYYNYGIAYSYTDADGTLTASVVYDSTVQATYKHNYTQITSANAAAAYADILGTLVGGHDMLYGVDIWQFTKTFVAETGLNLDDCTLSFTNHSLEFELLTEKTVNSGTTSHTAFTGAVTFSVTGNALGISGLDTANAEQVTQLIVKRPYYTAIGSDALTLTPPAGTAITSPAVSFTGCTPSERDKYINGQAPQLYIGNGNTTIDVLNITASGTYIGDPASTGRLVLPTRLSAAEVDGKYIDYNMYYLNEPATALMAAIDADTQLTSAERSALIAALFTNDTTNTALTAFMSAKSITGIPSVQSTYEGKDLLGNAATGHFKLEDGVLTMNSSSLVVYNGTLVLSGKIRYTDDEAYDYYLIRTLYSPASGLGGDESQYTSSNSFDKIFNETSNWVNVGTKELTPQQPYIVTQIEYTVKTDSTTYPEQTITSTSPSPSDTGSDYFKVEHDGSKFKLTVTTANIPTENSTVTVSVTISDDGGAQNFITETYSFIIPGVYLYGRDIKDIRVYMRMLNTYGSADGYILCDYLRKDCASFDCSADTILSDTSAAGTIKQVDLIGYGVITGLITPANPCDLGGIQYAVGTHEFKFDGLTVASLSPFAEFERSAVTKLSMIGCGITTAMLQGAETTADPYSPLYKLNQLAELDLSGNTDITSIQASTTDYIFYRTLTKLNLDSCALTSLDGVTSLVNLEEIHVKSNSIKDFYPLTRISTLKSAYIGNNHDLVVFMTSKSITGTPDVQYSINETATAIMAAIEADTQLTQTARSELLAALFTNDTTNTALTAFMSTKSITGTPNVQYSPNEAAAAVMEAIKADTLLTPAKRSELIVALFTFADSYYGTHGTINLCNIVSMMHNGVDVYVGATDTLVRIYEKYGENYYYKGEMAATKDITVDNESTLKLLTDGHLITIEQEYLSVVVNAIFNFDNYKVSANDYHGALAEIFLAGLTIGENTTGNTASAYAVTAVDVTADDTSALRTYRIKIKYSGSSDYRFKDNYAEGVSNSDYMEVWREITFTVTLS